MTAAVGATVVAFAAFTRESLEQERGVRRLSSTLDRMGIAYADVRGELDEFATSQQRATRFGDDETRASVNRIAQLTGALQPSVAELIEFAAIAADVAEAREQDLVTTSNAIGRAVAGDVEMLARFLPAFKDTLREIAKLPDAADRGATALDLLESEFQGAATALDPLDLALSRMRNGMGDVREALGDLVRESPATQGAFGAVADVIDEVAAALDPASENAEGFKIVITETARAAGIAMLGMTRAVVGSFRVVRGIVNELFPDADARPAIQEAQEGLAGFQQNFARRDLRRGLGAAQEAGVISDERAGQMLGALGGSPAQQSQVLQQVTALQEDLAEAFTDASMAAGAALERFNAGDAALRALETTFTRALDSITGGGGAGGAGGAGGGDGGGDGEAAPTRATGRRAPDSPFASAEVLHGQGVQRGMADLFGQQAEEDVSALRSQVDALGQTLFGVAATGFDAATAAVDSFAESTEASRAELETFFETAERGAPSMQSAFTSLGHSIGDVTVRSAVLDEAGSISLESFKDSAVDALGAVAQTGFAELGQAMAGVETEKFSKIALRAIGTMATGIGSVMIAAGVPMLIPGLPPFFNPVQGAALIAAGGTLTAIGSALGAVGAPAAAAAGGGGDGGFEGTGARDSAQRAATQRETPRTTVVQIGTLVTEDAETVRKLERDTQRQIDLGGLETVGAW